MLRSSTKSVLFAAAVGIFGLAVFLRFVKPYVPQASADLRYSRSQVIEIARNYLQSQGFDLGGLSADANFRFDAGSTKYLEKRLGLAAAHQALRADSLSTHFWDVYFFDRKLPPSQMRNEYRIQVSPGGRIRGFEHEFPDSTSVPSLNALTARALAEKFLLGAGHDLSHYELVTSSVNDLAARRDFTYIWAATDSTDGMSSRLSVDVHGDRIGRYRSELREPESYQKQSGRVQTTVTFVVTASSVATFVLLIFIIALFLKKYHDGEVGVKTAIYVFCILFAITLVEHGLRFTGIGYGMRLGDVNRFNVRIIVFFITAFIVQAFMAAMVFAGWSVGESSARRGWSDKLRSIDGLRFGKPFTLELANAVTRGYSFGLALLGLLTATFVLAGGGSGFYVVGMHGIPESIAPSFSAVFLALRVALLNEIVFRFFFISWLREKTGRTWHGLLVSSLLWTLLAFILWDFPLASPPFRVLFPAFFLLSLVLGLIVVRYDLMTAALTNFVLLAFAYASPLFTASASFYELHRWIFLLIMALPISVAAVGYVKRQRFDFTPELTPTHIKRISERERMARELEIARTVQMSLLPKENPLAEGYDIAGICIPALEVGGDYYDFFQLGDGKIGIAIGDVSGKGVPAAIYMTLTKGILQSHAAESLSPREVLSKLNRQMYINIERSSFVSMFYAVLDMRRHKIRFSRAGHNPAILAQHSTNSSTLIQPQGIALGLEAGSHFHGCLEEHELPLQSGDVLTFYTDGFTEASDATGNEFGEDRLEREISAAKERTANGIIQQVVRSVKTFVGSHPQHDDMTMVVLKVL